eukprot:5972489-Pyramimonas_sp.AAC.1
MRGAHHVCVVASSTRSATHKGPSVAPVQPPATTRRSGPIRRRKRGYILTMDQSDTGSAGIRA